MAGRGPAPKDPSRRARRNKDAVQGKQIQADSIEPYDLPMDLLPDGEQWHPATLRWWKRWCESPLAANLPAVDWSEMEATAVLHHEYMKKRSFTLGSELRLRMGKFGSTPEDRARLRIQVANADEKEESRSKPAGQPAKEKFGKLMVLPTPDARGTNGGKRAVEAE